MADIRKTRKHNLEHSELKQKLESLAEDMRKKFGIKVRWEVDVCHLSGAGVKSGKVVLTDSDISIEMTLGMMAKMLKGKIEKELDERLNKLVGA